MSAIGYFNAGGELLLVRDGGDMTPPDGTEYVADLPSGATANNVYYDEGVQFKQQFPITVTRNLIAGIPPGTSVGVNHITDIVDDGEFEFVADVEETVRVTLSHPHYLYESVAVETGP